jgi:hypothetical protein
MVGPTRSTRMTMWAECLEPVYQARQAFHILLKKAAAGERERL